MFGAFGMMPAPSPKEKRDGPCHDCGRMVYVRLGEPVYEVTVHDATLASSLVDVCQYCFVDRLLQKSGGKAPPRSR